jgi:hypothetical protein
MRLLDGAAPAANVGISHSQLSFALTGPGPRAASSKVRCAAWVPRRFVLAEVVGA